jgi:hypothetical protein
MTRHDLLHIHPAKTSWQETMEHALEAIYAAVLNQNEGSTHRFMLPAPGKTPTTWSLSIVHYRRSRQPAQWRRPEIPIAYRLNPRGSYM